MPAVWAGGISIILGGNSVQTLIKFLPILIVVAFPILYSAAAAGNTNLSILGIVTLFVGMSGPILKNK